MTEKTFTCPGRTMPQPEGSPEEGYVACYRAGHKCTTEVVTDRDEHGVSTKVRCGCCGEGYSSTYVPHSMASAGDPNTVNTPEETEALPPGQWVIDAKDTKLCLVDTHMGWPQRMFMTAGASSFVAVDHVAYPLRLADIADETPCPHSWGANECGHCRRCGVVTDEARPMYFEPFAEAVVHMAAEHNSKLPKGANRG